MHTSFGQRLLPLAAAAATLASTTPADARLVRFDVRERMVVAGGAAFGERGAYEKLTGTAGFEADPRDPANAGVFDIDKAPRNAQGRVQFSADAVILKPVDMTRSNGALFFEVNNRGNKIALPMLQDTPPGTPNNNPVEAAHFGNGWLMRQGYVIAWVGWGADIAPGNDRLTVDFPIAQEDGQPVSERIVTEYSDRNFGGGTPTSLPLSGGSAFKSYPAVSTDAAAAEAELRVRRSDSPPRPDARIPPGVPVPAGDWAFADCPNGWPGTPSTGHLCLKDGFRNDRVYELRYRATNSPVMGLGYLTSRDWVAWLKSGRAADDGQPNPVAGLDRALCLGISSSGMYYRDYLYQGFNQDEEGRRVCDGVHIHIPGAHKLYLNYRFAQPNPFSVEHRERYVPDTNFPRRYQWERDPVTNQVDAILQRPRSDPKVIHTDSSTEYWQFRSSLVDTDDQGAQDLRHPRNLRRYLYSSTQHFPTKGATPSRGVGERQCQQPSNVTHPGPHSRALVQALDRWVTARELPPPDRVPRIADDTLVTPERLDWPRIPGVVYRGQHNASGERDFGPREARNRGVIDWLHPLVLSGHRVLVPQVDRFGNDAAGIRHPYVEAPVATLTGWNMRTPEFSAGDLCDLSGMTVPLATTREERLAQGDPRPSLEELYGTHDGYVDAVRRAAEQLQRERLMLQEDVDRIVEEAEASDVLR